MGGCGGRYTERVQNDRHVGVSGGFVAGYRHMVGVDTPQVDAVGLGPGQHLVGTTGHPGQHRVEVLVVHQRIAQCTGDSLGVGMHPACDGGQPARAVVARVHRGKHRQQHLCGADVAGGLVAADVLLASLQRQPIGRRAVTVDGHTDQPAGQLTRMLGVHRKVPGMRAAKPHRHSEPLCGAKGDVSADLSGRRDQRQRQQVGADGHQCATVVGLLHQGRPVGDPAAGPGQLGDDAEKFAVGQTGAQVGRDDLDTQRLGAGGQHRRGLGEHVGVHDHPLHRPAGRAVHQSHGLGRRGALVEHRRVRDLEAGQIGDQGLEVQQGFQPTLTNLGLVRRVGGIPGRVLDDVAQQHRGGVCVVVALPDHRHGDGVSVGQRSQLGQRLGFAGSRWQTVQTRCGSGVGECV